MNSNYTPYTLYGTRDLAALSDFIEKTLLKWAKKWFTHLDVVIHDVITQNEFHHEKTSGFLEYYVTKYADKKWCSINIDSNASCQIELSLCGITKPKTIDDKSHITGEVFKAAINDLSNALLSSTGLEYSTGIDNIPTYSSEPGSGCMYAKAEIAGQQIYISLSEDICANYALTKSSVNVNEIELIQLKSAIRDTPIHLDIMLGSTQLDIKSLAKLNVGDVIEMDKSITELCDVNICGKNVNIGSYIGRVDEMIAAELFSK